MVQSNGFELEFLSIVEVVSINSTSPKIDTSGMYISLSVLFVYVIVGPETSRE